MFLIKALVRDGGPRERLETTTTRTVFNLDRLVSWIWTDWSREFGQIGLGRLGLRMTPPCRGDRPWTRGNNFLLVGFVYMKLLVVGRDPRDRDTSSSTNTLMRCFWSSGLGRHHFPRGVAWCSHAVSLLVCFPQCWIMIRSMSWTCEGALGAETPPQFSTLRSNLYWIMDFDRGTLSWGTSWIINYVDLLCRMELM